MEYIVAFIKLLMIIIWLVCSGKSFAESPIGSKSVLITGEVKKTGVEKVYIIFDETKDSTIIQYGKFYYEVNLYEGRYLDIQFGKEFRIQIFVFPGEKVQFFVPSTGYQELMSSGMTADRMRYFIMKDKVIRQVMDQNGFFKSVHLKDKWSFLSSIDSVENEMKILLKNTKLALSKNNEFFRRTEEQNILYFFAWMRMNYVYAHWVYTKENFDYQDSAYFNFTHKIDRDNVKYFNQLPNYKSYISNYVFYRSRQLWVADSSYALMNNGSVIAQMNVIHQYFSNPVIKDHLYFDMMKSHIEFSDASQRLDNAIAQFKNFCTNDSLEFLIEELSIKKTKLSRGKAAPDFEMYDQIGNRIKLSDFRGEPVIIDVWATWCGPCLREMPFFDSLKIKYDSKGIKFISVSIDENKESWEKYINRKKISDLQYYAPNSWSSEICKNYLISGIPQYIFVDAEGKIVSSNAPIPSDPKLEQMIAEHLSINGKVGQNNQ